MERKSEQLRNVGFVAHVGSGKTSLAEAMLFNGKATNRLGKVDDGTSNMDFEPEEIKRKITISTAIHHCNWKKQAITHRAIYWSIWPNPIHLGWALYWLSVI